MGGKTLLNKNPCREGESTIEKRVIRHKRRKDIPRIGEFLKRNLREQKRGGNLTEQGTRNRLKAEGVSTFPLEKELQIRGKN